MKADYPYRLPKTTTPEALESRLMYDRGTILNYGDSILVAGYYYNPEGHSYYGAIYRFTSADHTCEGSIELVRISDAAYVDNGHAIAWALSTLK